MCDTLRHGGHDDDPVYDAQHGVYPAADRYHVADQGTRHDLPGLDGVPLRPCAGTWRSLQGTHAERHDDHHAGGGDLRTSVLTFCGTARLALDFLAVPCDTSTHGGQHEGQHEGRFREGARSGNAGGRGTYRASDDCGGWEPGILRRRWRVRLRVGHNPAR